jgi:hypothetical protein
LSIWQFAFGIEPFICVHRRASAVPYRRRSYLVKREALRPEAALGNYYLVFGIAAYFAWFASFAVPWLSVLNRVHPWFHPTSNQISNRKNQIHKSKSKKKRPVTSLATCHTSPQFWLGLQMDYELDLAQDASDERIKKEVKPMAATG